MSSRYSAILTESPDIDADGIPTTTEAAIQSQVSLSLDARRSSRSFSPGLLFHERLWLATDSALRTGWTLTLTGRRDHPVRWRREFACRRSPALTCVLTLSRTEGTCPKSRFRLRRTSFVPETRSAANVVELHEKRSKINEIGRYPPAHNGPVAGSSPARAAEALSCFHCWAAASYLWGHAPQELIPCRKLSYPRRADLHVLLPS